MLPKILNTIIASKNAFLIQLKGNCSKLFNAARSYVALAAPITAYGRYEQQRGRINQWHVSVYHNELKIKSWGSISRLVKVRRWGIEKRNPMTKPVYMF